MTDVARPRPPGAAGSPRRESSGLLPPIREAEVSLHAARIGAEKASTSPTGVGARDVELITDWHV